MSSLDPLSHSMTSNMAYMLGQLIQIVNVDAFDIPTMLQGILQRFVDCLKSICLPQVRVISGALSVTLLARQLTRCGCCFRNMSLLLPFMEQRRITTELWTCFKATIDSALRLANAEEVGPLCIALNLR